MSALGAFSCVWGGFGNTYYRTFYSVEIKMRGGISPLLLVWPAPEGRGPKFHYTTPVALLSSKI